MPLDFLDPNDPAWYKPQSAGALVPTAPASNPAQSIYDAQTKALAKKRALIDLSNPSNSLVAADNAAGRNLLDYSNPSNPLVAASYSAKRALVDATGRYSGQQRDFYNTMGGIINDRTGETTALQNATHDVADLTAVAQATAQRRAVNALRDAVGMQRPIEINTPQGDTTALPAGVVRSLRPNADYISENIKDAEAQRTNKIAALRNNLDLGQLDVGDVKRQGDIADLNLGQGQQSASYLDKLSGENLRQALAAAGFEQNAANADVTDLSRGPYGKELYIDPSTGESKYVTPQEKDALDYKYRMMLEQQRLPDTIASSIAKQQATTAAQNAQSPMAGYDESDFARLLYADESRWVDVYNEIKRRSPGIDDMAARLKVQQILVAARGQKARDQAARDKETGGTGPKIDRPAFGP